MKKPYSKELTTHAGPESCAVIREDAGEALTGESAGQDIEPRKVNQLLDANAVLRSVRLHSSRRYSETRWGPARSKTLCRHGNTSRENREAPCLPAKVVFVGRVGKSKDKRRR